MIYRLHITNTAGIWRVRISEDDGINTGTVATASNKGKGKPKLSQVNAWLKMKGFEIKSDIAQLSGAGELRAVLRKV